MRKAELKELSHAAETAVAEFEDAPIGGASKGQHRIGVWVSSAQQRPTVVSVERLRHNKPSSQTAYSSLGVMRLVGGVNTCRPR